MQNHRTRLICSNLPVICDDLQYPGRPAENSAPSLPTGHFSYVRLRLQDTFPTGQFAYYRYLDISPTYFLECEVVALRLKNAIKCSKSSFVSLLNFRLMPLNMEYIVPLKKVLARMLNNNVKYQ